jgi:hypothetical protein
MDEILTFNDAIIPANTTYLVNLIDANNKQVAGYPQRFYLQGSTVDLSTLTPASNVYAKFPNAIVSQPSANGLQSIAGPLSLGAYSLTYRKYKNRFRPPERRRLMTPSSQPTRLT